VTGICLSGERVISALWIEVAAELPERARMDVSRVDQDW
jgi:hypothetical protein